MPSITIEQIGLAISGIILFFAGIHRYITNIRSPTPVVPPGVYKVSSEESLILVELRRIADALEAANDEKTRDFQEHVEDQLKRLEEAMTYKAGHYRSQGEGSGSKGGQS